MRTIFIMAVHKYIQYLKYSTFPDIFGLEIGDVSNLKIMIIVSNIALDKMLKYHFNIFF